MGVLGIIQAFGPVINSIKYATDLIKEDNELSINLKSGLKSIHYDLQMMEKKVEEYDKLELQELVYEIEDFTEGLWSPGALGPFLSAIGKNPKGEHLDCITKFQGRINDLKIGQQKSPETGSSAAISSTASAGGSLSTGKEDLVGIHKPFKELVELLSPLDVKETQLKVVSIVGCHGIGKTAIARAVYEDYCHHQSSCFDFVVWIVASKCRQKKELHDVILEAVQSKAGTTFSKFQDIPEQMRYSLFLYSTCNILLL